MPIRQVFRVNSNSSLTSAGLLVLRLFVGLGIFIKHGIEKLTGYSTMVHHFPHLMHIDPHLGLAFATLSDGICSLLLVVGLAARPAALVCLINLTVAFLFVHHAGFLTNDHTELVFMYIGALLTLLITGPGTYSADSKLSI
jgi:putative oxidoreductase